MIRQIATWPGLKRAGVALAVLAGTALALGPVQGGGQKSDAEVKSAIKVERGDNGKLTINLTLTINKGWYIYANPVGNEDFAANATTVTVKPKPQAIDISYPAGTLKKDKQIGDYRIYEDQVTIPIQIRRAQGDTAALELDVRLNACNTKMFCLPPGTLKITVP